MTDSQRADDVPLDQGAPGAIPRQPAHAVNAPWLIMRFGRFIYTHNPFYIASVWMVFSGLRASFDVSHGSIDAWALTLCLMAYTLLLGVTAFLVIRLGKVWDC